MKRCFFTLLAFLCAGTLLVAQKTITGTVVDSDGETLIGVNIVEVGTTNGTTTDFDGAYELLASEGSILEFSYTGFSNQVVTVGAESTINITLEEGVALDEVVVTALGISREKKALGYSVTEVGGEDLSIAKENNVVNSLSGRVAGVVVTQSTGGPGSGSRVVIRGNNSLTGNNQPLYVVDGVPIDNSGFGNGNGFSDPGTTNNGNTGVFSQDDYGTGISDINPDDIESMSVLKGPNAAALYGSRAANGVILITTKKGSARKGIGVTYSTNLTFEEPLLLPDYQNEYGQGSNGDITRDFETLRTIGNSWGARLDGSSQLYYTGEQRPYVAQPDNVKDFFRTGSNWVNTIALDGGSKDANLRFSYTNTQSEAIVDNSDMDRNNFNLRGFVNLTDRFSLDARVTYFTQDAKNRVTQGTEGLLANVYTIPRNVAISDLEDYQNESDLSTRGITDGGGNPYWVLNNNTKEDTRDRVYGFAKATYKFTDWLSAFVRVGTDVVNQNIETVTAYGHWFFPTGRFNYQKFRTSETNTDFLLMFNKSLSSDWSLSANLGGNALYATGENSRIRGENFKIPSKPTTSSASTLFSDHFPRSEKKVHSLYASTSLSYRNMIYLDLSGRNDWSSTLPEDNWSFFYPSASLSYVLSESLNSNFFDLLKVRASWAQVGNDTDPYQLDNFFVLQQDSYLDLTTLERNDVRLNPDLKPEQISTFEIGTEFRFLNNRVYGDVAYYDIKSEDLIMDVPIPAATGYDRFRTNVGEITNKGYEILVGGLPFSKQDFSWDVSLNLAHNENELVSLVDDLENFVFSSTNGGTVVTQATVGGGFGDIYGRTWKRNDQGQIIVDVNGIPESTDERVFLGNYQPDWTGGFNNSVRYKDFKLNVLIDFRFGGQLYSGTDAALDRSGVSDRTLLYREGGVVVDGVVNTGTADEPVYETNTTQISAAQYWGGVAGIPSEYIYDQDNIRLREVSLTYTLPRRTIENTFIKGLSIGLVGRNLFFFSKDSPNFDPESSYSTSNFGQGFLFYNMPTTRRLGINLTAKF